MSESGPRIRVEVAYAEPARQFLQAVDLDPGATVGDALERAFAGVLDAETLARCQAGIWGRPVDRSRQVKDGDRVELYRELLIDPRTVRRERAAAGESMRARASD